MTVVDTRVDRAFGEPKKNDELVEFDIPDTRCLLEAVYAFDETANVLLSALSHEAFGLFHVDFFIKVAIEEGSLDV
jgi:hypothetical protein